MKTLKLLSVLILFLSYASAQTTTTNQTDYFKINTPSGYVQIGPGNTSFSHFITDRDKFYFNKSVYINGRVNSYSGNNFILGTYGKYQLTIPETTSNHGGRPNGNTPQYGIYIGGNGTGGVLNMGIDTSPFFYSWIQSRHKSSATYFDLALNPEGGKVGVGTATPSSTLHVESLGGGGRANGITPSQGLNIGANQTSGVLNLGVDASSTFYSWIQSRHKLSSSYFNLALNPEGGNVGIGKLTPTAKLHVNGNIIAEEIKVEDVTGADFVFAPNYRLMPLAEIEAFIKKHHHLPEVPSAVEMQADGVELGKMNMLLLQKIEELTLLMIEQNKKLDAQNIDMIKMQNELKIIKAAY